MKTTRRSVLLGAAVLITSTACSDSEVLIEAHVTSVRLVDPATNVYEVTFRGGETQPDVAGTAANFPFAGPYVITIQVRTAKRAKKLQGRDWTTLSPPLAGRLEGRPIHDSHGNVVELISE